MSDNTNTISDDVAHIQNLPLEIISKIVKHLSISDILALTSVSKIWRCVYLNQNVIWKDVCEQLNLQEEDYTSCLIDTSRYTSGCKAYIELNSEKLFGPCCKWWTIYNRYNMVVKNIKNNNFPTIHISREPETQSFCTDDYIISINRHSKYPIKALNLKGSHTSLMSSNRVHLKSCELLDKLFTNPQYSIKIIGNKKFMVIEIHSVIFVYKILNNHFEFMFTKVIQKSSNDDTNNEDTLPNDQFLSYHFDTKIDICDDKLALIHPKTNLIFLIDLNTGEKRKEIKYSSSKCVVDCMKCTTDRLMIGITTKGKLLNRITEYFAIVYHLEGGPSIDHKFKILLFGPATQFKVTANYIGVENKACQTPFITKITKLLHIFWLDCDTFSFDCTRKFIYYNVNRSIFQYDLNKARMEKFEVVQKIAINAISNHFSLTPINDRFLLVRSITPNAYEIFDVKEHVPVKCIQLSAGFELIHVGKLSIVFSNSKEFLIIAFS